MTYRWMIPVVFAALLLVAGPVGCGGDDTKPAAEQADDGQKPERKTPPPMPRP